MALNQLSGCFRYIERICSHQKIESRPVFFGLRKHSFSHIPITKNELSTSNVCIYQSRYKWEEVYTMSGNNGDSAEIGYVLVTFEEDERMPGQNIVRCKSWQRAPT